MTSLTYKFGRYLLYAFDDGEYACDFIPPTTSKVKELHNFSAFLKKISGQFLLVIDMTRDIQFSEHAIRRLLQIFENTPAGIIYADYFLEKENKLHPHQLNEYQSGSIRDDFDFGYVLLFSAAAIKTALQKYGPLPQEEKAALYDLRLKISIDQEIFHIPEFLYTTKDKKTKSSKTKKDTTEKHFAYVAAINQKEQKALEKVATNYLQLTGAYIKARTKKASSYHGFFPVEASIIIPVLNRKKTIATAIKSALSQNTDFDYNIIVVDNHSTDGTSDVIEKLALLHPEIIQIIPGGRSLNIGGCWNEAIYSPFCGRFAVQLDSDDLYSSPYALQEIIDKLRVENYAMVIGSYTIVNERMQEIPPGLIDHREWTEANGHNNALRVNGLGAPRAFNTAVLRQIGFPDVGYGEDYAVALGISREYQIGRIYKSLYLCRRWPGNTDSAISLEKQNLHDFYKDKLRTIEITARRKLNKRKISRARK
jgi:Glycosyl transferase family 2